MNYRSPDTSLADEDRAPLEGPDDVSASALPVLAVLAVLLLGAPVLAYLGGWRAALAFVLGLIALHALDRRTRSFSLSIDDDTIVLRSFALGCIPVRRRKLPLAYELSFNEYRDEWGWPGLHLSPPSYAVAGPMERWPDDVLFGSVLDLPRARALFERIQRRIESARRARAALDVDRHLDPTLGDLAFWWPVIDPETVTRNTWGRVASARTIAPAEHGELGMIPAGSTLYFCPDDRFRVRATPDIVTSVEFSAPSDELHVLADLDPPAIPSRAGARVTLMTIGTRQRPVSFLRFETAFDAVTFGGHPVRGTAVLEARNGELVRCTLEEPFTALGIALPAGCEASTSTHEFIVTSPAPYEDRGRVIEPPVHLHFAHLPGRTKVPLREILRDPDRFLRARSPSNPTAHTAPVTPPSKSAAR